MPDLQDADLQRQLRRRASSADVLGANELIYAVRQASSPPTPQRLPAPRFAGLATAAAVVAIVALLVVSLPRSGPAVDDPTASPSVVAGFDDQTPAPSLADTMPPTAGTTEPVPAGRTIDCPYAEAQAERPLEVSIADRTGLVAECSARGPGLEAPVQDPGDGVALGNPDGDALRLRASWMVGALCNIAPAALEFIRTDSGYVLIVDVIDTEGRPTSCRPAQGYQGVTITLAAPVSADDVDGLLTYAGRGSALAETVEGHLSLSIGSGAHEYAAGDAIDIDAMLRYSGPAEKLLVTGSTSGLVHFGLEQLDGDIRVGPGWDDACQRYELAAEDTLRVSYAKSGGYSNDDPNADFYRRFFVEPELRLPPGVWRVHAITPFALGDCGGAQVSLSASVIVLTTAVAAVGPTPPPEASLITAPSPPTAEPTSSPAASPTPTRFAEGGYVLTVHLSTAVPSATTTRLSRRSTT